jgi:uncharacterized protein
MEMTAVTEKLFPPQKVFVAPAGLKGFGVFASEAIQSGEIVERAPVRKVSVSLERHFEEYSETLYRYLFWWKGDESDQDRVEAALAFGFASFYNHSPIPNMELEYDFENSLLSFVAIRDVSQGEELTFDYGRNIWFQVVE